MSQNGAAYIEDPIHAAASGGLFIFFNALALMNLKNP
jgi:hypothetical protein